MGAEKPQQNKSVALLGSGSPSSFYTDAVTNDMLQGGAASSDVITLGKPRRWGGFTDPTEEALKTNYSACLSVQFSLRWFYSMICC